LSVILNSLIAPAVGQVIMHDLSSFSLCLNATGLRCVIYIIIIVIH
jgi:hypothetical protein